ncbi:TIGR02221 family CRISPR-associated protein [Anabaena sp. FACHB-1237]|uniref:TIGR02221 family CRISPR-associated protein n=1 Tax=Anabaena sp. FACHB-1237 TaxID=2692769 RepID=UPI0016805638|nr:TIGR02221 family CRISPR-associated protein [Anabaena sp. FACHB-1237]MBD2137688.1 TIGR02221 family CRISPR-associated protein [Anabaena sp. FACHB-1237]
MKAISFLGFNKRGYQETTYLNPIASGEYKTKFIQQALVEFYKPETLYVLLTDTAAKGIPDNETESSWTTLQNKLADKVDLQPIMNIPEGHTTSDIWKLFQMLTDCLQDGDRVLFDITNGFRSLPVLALIAVSYLRVVRQVQIEGLIYGAFDAKSNDNKTPIFDLLPIVSLLEWTTATDQFLKTGNAQALAGLLHNGDPSTEDLANNIDKIAQGLQLLRPIDVMQQSALLPEKITTASSTISQSLPPFTTLLKRVENDYGKFALKSPTEYTISPQSSLIRQLRMVEWYAEKGQIVQALSIAREWLPSLLCYHFNIDPQVERPNRSEMELLLNGGTGQKDSQGNRYISPYLEQYKASIPQEKRTQLSNLWSNTYRLANLRNDVLHAGFRKNPQGAEYIIQQTKQIVEELRNIAQVWDLKDEE